MTRGRNTCMGYLWDEANTQKLIDVDDWVHSGDLGRVDQDGFFYVTGRLKVHYLLFSKRFKHDFLERKGCKWD